MWCPPPHPPRLCKILEFKCVMCCPIVIAKEWFLRLSLHKFYKYNRPLVCSPYIKLPVNSRLRHPKIMLGELILCRQWSGGLDGITQA